MSDPLHGCRNICKQGLQATHENLQFLKDRQFLTGIQHETQEQLLRL